MQSGDFYVYPLRKVRPVNMELYGLLDTVVLQYSGNPADFNGLLLADSLFSLHRVTGDVRIITLADSLVNSAVDSSSDDVRFFAGAILAGSDRGLAEKFPDAASVLYKRLSESIEKGAVKKSLSSGSLHLISSILLFYFRNKEAAARKSLYAETLAMLLHRLKTWSLEWEFDSVLFFSVIGEILEVIDTQFYAEYRSFYSIFEKESLRGLKLLNEHFSGTSSLSCIISAALLKGVRVGILDPSVGWEGEVFHGDCTLPDMGNYGDVRSLAGYIRFATERKYFELVDNSYNTPHVRHN